MALLEKLNLENPAEQWEYLFFCPGCESFHGIRTHNFYKHKNLPTSHPVWTISGFMNKPSVSPSILVNHPKRCHLFIRDGMIKYLNDCEHALKGTEIPLIDCDDI